MSLNGKLGNRAHVGQLTVYLIDVELSSPFYSNSEEFSG